MVYVDIERDYPYALRPRAGAGLRVRVEHVLIYTALY